MDLFLLILSVVLAAGTAITTLTIKREHAAIGAATEDYRARDLDHYELAYLAGGAQRVADTAIGLLADAGDIRVARGGRVHHVEGARVSREPVEETVLGTVASNSGISAGSLRRMVAGSLAVETIKQHLARLGMIPPDGSFTRARRLGGGLGALSTVSLVGALFSLVLIVLGGTRLLLFPAVIICTGASVAAMVVAWRNQRTVRATLTSLGREVLEAARRAAPRGDTNLPVAVALHGLGELRNPGLQAELLGVGPAQLHGRRSYRRGGSSGGGGSSGCSAGVPAHGCGGGSHGCGGGSSSCGGGGGCGGGGCGGGG
ncbi:TIGR04222 domain-containing membrane protein [Nonomuraea sp. B12E4]|uniref:TIGR04222 domain-containing membrane protein n=1 Tax=Nonomuraea sp. B12E4 TaxID=3153564 RepID=UPI00325F227D